jgi:hypothetical protein
MLTRVGDPIPGRQGTRSRDRYGHKSRRGDFYGPSAEGPDAAAHLRAATPSDAVKGSGGFDDQRKEPFGFGLVVVGVPAFTDTVAAENEVSVRRDVVAA